MIQRFRRGIAGVCGALMISVGLTSCEGILSGIYDTPEEISKTIQTGQTYVDASDWTEWHYLDLPTFADAMKENPGHDPASDWVTVPIPRKEIQTQEGWKSGIYTYWYDVYGAGIGKHEYRSFLPTEKQPEPESWSIAVHRNNVRTNGGAAAATGYTDINAIPQTKSFLATLNFQSDEWNETDVWTDQGKMLLGIIGNQGIEVNPVLSSWLAIWIPPMPPSFTMNDSVFVVRLKDGTYAALQLHDYQSPTGTKCVLTINYRYPLTFE